MEQTIKGTTRQLVKYFDPYNVKTHLLSPNGQDHGLSGWFPADFLIEHFGDNIAYYEEYEKDFGDGAVGTISYLGVTTNKEEDVEYYSHLPEAQYKIHIYHN